LKGRVYVDKSHSLQEMQDYIRGEIADASRHVLRRGPRNIFRRWEACLEAGSRHFEDLLWNKVSWTARGKRILNSARVQGSFVMKFLRQLPCSWTRLKIDTVCSHPSL